MILWRFSVLPWQSSGSRTNIGSIQNLFLLPIPIRLMNDTRQRVWSQISKFLNRRHWWCQSRSLTQFIWARVRIFSGKNDSLENCRCGALWFRRDGSISGLLLGLDRVHVRTGFAEGKFLVCVNLNGRSISLKDTKGKNLAKQTTHVFILTAFYIVLKKLFIGPIYTKNEAKESVAFLCDVWNVSIG